MGDLKPQDTDLSSTEPVTKRKQGNPNLKKGVKNPYYASDKNAPQEQKNMADEKVEEVKAEVVKDTSTSSDVSGEKKVIPDDTFSDVIPVEETLPLDGEVKVKDYATLQDTTAPKTDGGGTGGNNNPPPPPPNADGTTTPPPDPNNPNPTATPMPGGDVKTPEQVRTEAEQFVKLLIRGYDKLHGVMRWYAKVDPNDLMLMHEKRKINLDYNLPLGTGVIGLRKFFADYNLQIEDDIKVSDDFKKEIEPPLTRIAIKKGWGLGDEGTVLLLLSEDLGTKVALLYGLKKTCNMVLESCMAIMKSQNERADKKDKAKSDDTAGTNATDLNTTGNEWRESLNNNGVQEAEEVK